MIIPRILLVATLAASLILGIGCTHDDPGKASPPEGPNAVWSVVVSPQTRRCYEVLSWAYRSGNMKAYGFAAMAGVPCDEVLVEVEADCDH